MSKILNNIDNGFRVFTIGKKKSSLSLIRGYSNFEYIQKRVVDYLMVSLFVLLLWPIFLYSIYRIKKESKGAILFKQSRVGLDGKPFTCYKFRSMHTNSHFDPYTKDNDSRIFPYGQIMRKLRIDELAQLLNVIKGDMHIVDPRAEWDILVSKYEKIIPDYRSRHKVKPGITGLAQTKYPYGRNAYDARRKLGYDLLYIKKWSIFLEIKVLFETILVVVKKSGV